MRSHISGKVDHTVILGQAGYGDALTVSESGVVAPAYSMLPQVGADGIDIAASVARAMVLNQGSIVGAEGSKAIGVMAGYTGGLGIDFSSSGRLDNQGTVAGGAGGSNSYAAGNHGAGGHGGVGILLGTGAMLANEGVVSGGAGAVFYNSDFQNKGGDGGAGVNLATGAALANAGTVLGGAGGYSYGAGVGNGGAGIQASGSDRLSNSGTIKGGDGGGGGGIARYFYGTLTMGVGGTGVSLGDASRLTNTGLIEGGLGGGGPLGGIDDQGGVGVELAGAATLVNGGTIAGGVGGDVNYGNYYLDGVRGGAGVVIDASGTVTNTGHITGGNAGYAFYTSGNHGGVGVNVGTGTLNNSGSIAGGIGDPGYGGLNGEPGFNAAGGIGVTLAGGKTLNSGTITGGAGLSRNYSSGGVGLSLTSGTVVNTGIIAGGVGGNGYASNAGGAGVALNGGVLSNAGTILGGAGGSNFGAPRMGGAGGAGAATLGGMLTNTGLIQGGQGGAGLPGTKPKYGIATGGNGGAGVYLNGGTLVTAGTIAGGLGGASKASPGVMGDAVQFGTLAGTLVIDPGAVFHGAIVADSAAADTLALAGTASGTLTGFGTSITGFTTITEDAHAHWTLTGSVSGTGVLGIGSGAALTLNGAVSIASIAFAGEGHETLQLAVPGQVTSIFAGFATGDAIDLETIKATSLRYRQGTLTLYDGKTLVDTLHFAGTLTGTDFGLSADGHGGTNIVYETGAYRETSTTSAFRLPAHGSDVVDRYELLGHTHLPV